MRLGGVAISDALQRGAWKAYRGRRLLKPRDLHIGPNSVDLSLGRQLLVDRGQGVLDPRNPDACRFEQLDCRKGCEILPGQCLLGFARERFVCDQPLSIDNRVRWFTSQVDGRSSVGRMFLFVHVTAGFGDVGFSGNYTLELLNANRRPILLFEGMRIAQISFEEVCQPLFYDGAYSKEDHRDRPVPPRLGPGRF